MPDSGASGGTAGAAGSGGKAGSSGAAGAGGAAGKGGSSGAAGSAGKAGSSGAGGTAGAAGAAGSAGKDGGSAGSAGSGTDGGGTDAGQCPATQPAPGNQCSDDLECKYGPVTCNCLDPGPMGTWACGGGPVDGGPIGDAAGMCPPMQPDFGDACPDGGYLGPCLYDSGHSECTCDPAGVGWSCIRH